MSQEYRKKLIEVALPIEAINRASAHEKMPGIGAHPRGVHYWWARRPLATCRAVLFASLVDDPSAWPELFPTKGDQETERMRLFEIIEKMVKWENFNDHEVLLSTQTEIARSISRSLGEAMPVGPKAISAYIAENAPSVFDPFCGGGSIPLEAVHLGLGANGNDLNPVSVLITKALIEIPVLFVGRPAVNPDALEDRRLTAMEWNSIEGLVSDIRFYGQWIRGEAQRRIGYLYPKVKITEEMASSRSDLKPYVGQELNVLTWLWTRTVKCPNPACGARMPLITSYWLSSKKGREAWIAPFVDPTDKTVQFHVHSGDGSPPEPPKMGRGARFKCVVCGQLAEEQHIYDEGMKGRMSPQLMAVIAQGKRGRIYLAASEHQVLAAGQAKVTWKPEQPLANAPRYIAPPLYGMKNFGDLFTNRQLVALVTLSELVKEVHGRIVEDARLSKTLPEDDRGLDDGGKGPRAYADAVATYLAFAIDRCADYNCALSVWKPSGEQQMNLFIRQVIPMVWNYAEANLLGERAICWSNAVAITADALESCSYPSGTNTAVQQRDAASGWHDNDSVLVSTDPPYYDNIGYADLSDFYYVWLRRTLSDIYPQLFSTVLTPKNQELIASPSRHEGSKKKAQSFFEEGLSKFFQSLREIHDRAFPITLYYAFKQAESKSVKKSPGSSPQSGPAISTGWETMLTGLIGAGFTICGTWPFRSELSIRMLAAGTNALASSIVLACRPRFEGAPLATRREFMSALKTELPDALTVLQHGNIAPVDLAQASIGPGMSIFTRYSKVMESDGSPMTVRTALGLINQTLDEVLAEQEGEFDADSRWAIAWFEQHGMDEGLFGVAETLSKAKDTAVSGLVEAGILEAKSGKVRLLKRGEFLEDWDPVKDKRYTAWEATQYLIRALDSHGEIGAAALLRTLGTGHGEAARDLAYRLYNICERKGWATEALAYNSLVIAWPEITRLALASTAEGFGTQTEMFETE